MGDLESLKRLPLDDPRALRRHTSRRRVWTQIYLPLAVGLAVVVILAVLMISTGTGDASVWADVSLVLLAMPVFLVSFLFLIAASAMLFGVFRLRGVLPRAFRIAGAYVARFGNSARGLADRSVRPILFLEGASSAMELLGGKIGRIFSWRKGAYDE